MVIKDYTGKVRKKKCVKCKQWFPMTNEYFHSNKSTFDKYQKYCKKCKKNYNSFKKLYNISQKEYNKMFNEQNGVCKICGRKESTKGSLGDIRKLSIDHDHKTKKIRGLGGVEDNPLILIKMVYYLQKNKKIDAENVGVV